MFYFFEINGSTKELDIPFYNVLTVELIDREGKPGNPTKMTRLQ